jgi:hypothetical protein
MSMTVHKGRATVPQKPQRSQGSGPILGRSLLILRNLRVWRGICIGEVERG